MPSDFLTAGAFDRYSQELMDETYLMPLNGPPKSHARDGYVERLLHGATHAGSVATYVRLLHQLCEHHFSAYVISSLGALTKHCDYTKDQLLCLVSYVALGHDAGRKGEGYDCWERQSGQIVKAWLIKQGIPDQHADIFSMLIPYKDEAVELREHNTILPKEVVDGLDYCRRLLALSDCFDIIRCNGEFDYEYIAKIIKDMPGYSPERHDPIFFEFAVEVYQYLKNTHNIFFRTSLKAPDGRIVHENETEAYFSIPDKVAIEHTNNVLLAIRTQLRKRPYFANSLPKEAHATALTLAVPAVYNPLIHGTTSPALLIMAQTDFQLMGPLSLIKQYGLAPLSGELTQGGLAIIGQDCRPCFALLYNNSHYSLNKIIENYASLQNVHSVILEEAKMAVANTSLKNLNVLIVRLTQYRQLGGDVQLYAGLKEELHNMIQFFYFHVILGKYTKVNPIVQREVDRLSKDAHWAIKLVYKGFLYTIHAIKSIVSYLRGQSPPISVEVNPKAALGELFRQKNVLENIRKNKIDFKELHKNYTKVNYQALLTKLNLTFNGNPVFIPLDKAKATTKGPILFDRPSYLLDPPNDYSYNFILNKVMNAGPDLLGDYRFNTTLENYLMNHIRALEAWEPFLDTFFTEKSFNPTLNTAHSFITAPFPVILVNENFDFFNGVSIDGEFRANCTIQIGEDIKTVATDTVENQERLRVFFMEHKLNHSVNVILFETLRQKSYKPPHQAVQAIATPPVYSPRLFQQDMSQRGDLDPQPKAVLC